MNKKASEDRRIPVTLSLEDNLLFIDLQHLLSKRAQRALTAAEVVRVAIRCLAEKIKDEDQQ